MDSIKNKSAYAQEFVEGMVARSSCEWCKDPNAGIHRKMLCRHCYGLSRNLVKMERKAEKALEEFGELSFDLDMELQTVRQMVVDAKREGVRYGNLAERELDGISLESEFEYLSKIVAGKNLYHGNANLFNYCLSIPQKRFILYLLSEMSRIHRKKSRRSRAMGDVIMKRCSDQKDIEGEDA